MRWTQEQFDEYQRKRQARADGVCAAQPERSQGVPLVSTAQRKNTGSPLPAQRFKIVFIVYAVRPLDWDNYRLKDLQDCCVIGGLLSSDAWGSLEGAVISRKAYSKKDERTEIEIEQL